MNVAPPNFPARHLGPLAVIRITMATATTILEDGVEVVVPCTTQTWACGATERTALGRWKRANPALALLLQSHELLTPKPSAALAPMPHMGRPRLAAFRGAVGTRVKVKDWALEACAVGL